MLEEYDFGLFRFVRSVSCFEVIREQGSGKIEGLNVWCHPGFAAGEYRDPKRNRKQVLEVPGKLPGTRKPGPREPGKVSPGTVVPGEKIPFFEKNFVTLKRRCL